MLVGFHSPSPPGQKSLGSGLILRIMGDLAKPHDDKPMTAMFHFRDRALKK